jgi:hypothetical protein
VHGRDLGTVSLIIVIINYVQRSVKQKFDELKSIFKQKINLKHLLLWIFLSLPIFYYYYYYYIHSLYVQKFYIS